MKSNRRVFFKTMGAGAAGLTFGSTALSMASCASPSAQNDEDGQILFIGDNIAVTETQYGKVRGYQLRGIYYFIGMPYGADTSGTNRFMPPQKPDPWKDIYPAIWWGNSAPQPMEGRYSNKYNTFRDRWNYDDVSEDCLRINVFTPGYGDGKKRPVLFWMHGGQMINGNSIEQDGYNGENLARFGDVVFCSVNHRLGPFGFSDFSSAGGEKYAASGNVGMLDLILALEWVRDNIANFGGDPGNVTIMGQSGGGGKVCATLGMPSAKGLVHKAVVLSGAHVKITDKEIPQKLGIFILKEAGLNASQINRLQEMPWQEYDALVKKAGSKLAAETGISLGNVLRAHIDDLNLPRHPFYPESNPDTADIPMIISSATNEDSPSFLDPSLENISFEEVKKKLTQGRMGRMLYGLSQEKAEEIVNAYSSAFPEKKPVEIWSMIERHREEAVHLADSKSRQNAPVFNAWFGWQPPLFDNRMRSFHCSDICHWFYNTDLMLGHTGGGRRPRELSEKMAGYLVNFMKTGDPNREGLPSWPGYSTEKGEVMCLNDVCETLNDPDREARKTLPPSDEV